MNYEKTKVWGILLRLYHWSLVLSIIALVVTGFYINSPWTNTTLEGSVSFPMATMRYWHFLAGYLFTAAIAVRIFLLLFGNRQERIWDFLPITPRNSDNYCCCFSGYCGFLSAVSRICHLAGDWQCNFWKPAARTFYSPSADVVLYSVRICACIHCDLE